MRSEERGIGKADQSGIYNTERSDFAAEELARIRCRSLFDE